MALNIKHPEADRLVRILVEKTGETITEIVIEALRDRLLREQGRRQPADLEEDLLSISKRCANLPDQDLRSPDDILGYDDFGLPH
jgi:antitoxin VapB